MMNVITWIAAIAGFDQHLAAGGRARTTRRLRRSYLYGLADSTDHGPTAVELAELEAWLRRDWSPNSRKAAQASARGFFAWMHATGQRADNPAALLLPVRVPAGVPHPVPDAALRAAYAAADGRTRLMIELAATAGLRRAEIAAVHSDDVQTTIGGDVLRIVGKGGRTRLVPISDALSARIRAAGGWLFPSPNGGHMVGATVGRMVGRHLPPGFACHSLRHRFASVAYAADRDLRAVQELLGHASIATTQVYTAVPAGAMRRAAYATALDAA